MAKISIATILIRNHPMSNRLVAFLVLLVTIIIGGWALYYVFVTRGVKLELHITPANIDTRIDISYLQTPLTTTVCKTLCTISYPQKSGLSMEITASGYTSQSFDLSSSPTSLNIVLTKSLVTLESIKQSISSWSAVQERIKTLESRTQSNTGITFSWNILTITPQGSWSILFHLVWVRSYHLDRGVCLDRLGVEMISAMYHPLVDSRERVIVLLEYG